MRLLAFLFALVLSACSAGRAKLAAAPPSLLYPQYTHNTAGLVPMPLVTPVWIDKDFSPSQLAQLKDALTEWNFALNGYESFEVVSDKFAMEPEVIAQVEATGQGLVILDVLSSNHYVQEMGDGVLAWVPELGAHIMSVVGDRIGNRDLKAIILHELGHVLGLEHILVKSTLMFPNYNYGSPCIDKISVQQLASVRARFDWRHMNYCERPL
jgi:hypothetical protein